MTVTAGRITVLEPNGSDKNLDTAQVVTEAGTVEREMVSIGSPSDPSERVEVTGAAVHVSLEDITVVLRQALLQALNTFVAIDPSGGRMRVVLDAVGGAQTLGTVTTVGTLTAQTNVGGIAYRDAIFDPTQNLIWGQNVRSLIT